MAHDDMALLTKCVLPNELTCYEDATGEPRQDANRPYFTAPRCPDHGLETQAEPSETLNRNSLSDNAYGIFGMHTDDIFGRDRDSLTLAPTSFILNSNGRSNGFRRIYISRYESIG